MGGADKTVAAAQTAFHAGEYRRVAELLNQVVFAQPQHAGARVLLARSHEQLGYAAESAIWRNFYLSGALELRTGRTGNGPDPVLAIGKLEQAPVERFLDAMAAGDNGPKAANSRFRMNLTFSGAGASRVPWMENAVPHHRRTPPDPLADTTLTVTRPLFARLMTGTGSIKDLLLGDEPKVEGSTIALLRFVGLIEKASRSFAIVTPPG